MVKLKSFSYVPTKTCVITKGGKRKNIATYLGGENESQINSKHPIVLLEFTINDGSPYILDCYQWFKESSYKTRLSKKTFTDVLEPLVGRSFKSISTAEIMIRSLVSY